MSWYDYFTDGIRHITDPSGYDHMVYLIALIAIYEYREVKRIVLLITAFTVGHSLTLILAGLDVIRPNTDLIEFLIPVTILFTALSNLRYAQRVKKPIPNHGWRYLIAVVFGLIHGMGFSSYFRMIVDRDESIVQPLLYFNIGVEVGQLFFIALFLLASIIIQAIFRPLHRDWVIFFSGLPAGLAIVLCIETWPF